jgi:hypothetical protein
MDVGTVHAYADGFARAIKDDDRERIPSYLLQSETGRIAKVLADLPHPIRTAEVLNVTAPEDEQCISLTRFNGFRGGMLLRATWSEALSPQPVMCKAQIVERGRRR